MQSRGRIRERDEFERENEKSNKRGGGVERGIQSKEKTRMGGVNSNGKRIEGRRLCKDKI